MGFANARGPHQEQTLFCCAWVISNKTLGQELGFFQRVGLRRSGAYVGAVAFKIAMFVAFGDVGAFDDSFGAILHAAVAGDCNFASGAARSRDELPAGSFAKLAILESHAHSIRFRGRSGKLGAVGISSSSGDSVASFLNTEF